MKFYIEVTDTFGGEANYCWVKCFTVESKSEQGAMTKLSKAGYYKGFKKVMDCGDYWRYDMQGACICAMVEWYDEDRHSKYDCINLSEQTA